MNCKLLKLLGEDLNFSLSIVDKIFDDNEKLKL